MIESYKVRSSSKHLAPGKFLSPGCNNHTSHNSHIIGNGQIVTSSPFTVSTLASDAGKEIYSDSEYISVREMSKRYQFSDENKMDLNKRNTSTGYRSGSKNHHHHISTLSVNNAGYWSFSPSSAPESIVSDQVRLILCSGPLFSSHPLWVDLLLQQLEDKNLIRFCHFFPSFSIYSSCLTLGFSMPLVSPMK